MKYPDQIQNLINSFKKYPGIGAKTAERLALFTLNQLSEEDVTDFSKALIEAKEELFQCSVCGNITNQEPCEICKNASRDKSTILVVEEAKDIYVLEKTNQYFGKYHVLNGVISPIDGVGPEDINLRSLISRLDDDSITEVILALNASVNGETTSLYISRLLKGVDIKVTKLASGLPVGSDLQYADEITIQRALEGRREVK